MISAAALVPHPPLLLRELGGAQDPVADLRAACLATVRAVVAGAERVAVVGGADTARRWDPTAEVDVRRFGAARPRPAGASPPPSPPPSPPLSLPLSLGVGVRLLAEAGWGGPVVAHSLAWDADGAALEALAVELAAAPGRTAVVVLGDGSARRGERAPGYLDERAFPFDDAVAKALADGEAAEIAALDAGLARELMVTGATAFRFLGVLGRQQERRPEAALTFRDDPFGVSYLAATWLF